MEIELKKLIWTRTSCGQNWPVRKVLRSEPKLFNVKYRTTHVSESRPYHVYVDVLPLSICLVVQKTGVCWHSSFHSVRQWNLRHSIRWDVFFRESADGRLYNASQSHHPWQLLLTMLGKSSQSLLAWVCVASYTAVYSLLFTCYELDIWKCSHGRA